MATETEVGELLHQRGWRTAFTVAERVNAWAALVGVIERGYGDDIYEPHPPVGNHGRTPVSPVSLRWGGKAGSLPVRGTVARKVPAVDAPERERFTAWEAADRPVPESHTPAFARGAEGRPLRLTR